MNARAYLQRQWRQDGLLPRLLAPLSWIAGQIVRRKREAYRSGRKKAWRAPVPVVVVGNLYVGGTGKTPVVIAIAQGLYAQGWTPGVVSRGYGARVRHEPRVGLGANLDPADYGDEPALIARAAAVPVAVHPRRVLAAQALLRACPEVDVIIADALRRAAAGKADPVLVINADALATHQTVINILEAARIAGLPQLTFAAKSSGNK